MSLMSTTGSPFAFQALLLGAGVAPAGVVMLRHQPAEASLKRVFAWVAGERPDLFMAYQSIQWLSAERLMVKASYVAAFVGQASGQATFVGLYRLGEHSRLDYESYHRFPGNAELIALGMTGMEKDGREPLAFQMGEVEALAPYRGRLTVAWPKPERVWARWADRGAFPIIGLSEESRLQQAMPPWTELTLTWPQLKSLPVTWTAALAHWRGVYFIYDRGRGKGYVGSAYGRESLLGRWRAYAQSGHGGNKRLRESDPAQLLFSILQRVSPDMPPDEVIAIEDGWKIRLHTRDHGLNEN